MEDFELHEFRVGSGKVLEPDVEDTNLPVHEECGENEFDEEVDPDD